MRDLVFINGLMEKDMKDNLLMGFIMGLVFIIDLKDKLNTMENFGMGILMDGEFFYNQLMLIFQVRYYSDGGIYYGEWKQGKCHGKGTYYWENGSKYSGGFLV